MLYIILPLEKEKNQLVHDIKSSLQTQDDYNSSKFRKAVKILSNCCCSKACFCFLNLLISIFRPSLLLRFIRVILIVRSLSLVMLSGALFFSMSVRLDAIFILIGADFVLQNCYCRREYGFVKMILLLIMWFDSFFMTAPFVKRFWKKVNREEWSEERWGVIVSKYLLSRDISEKRKQCLPHLWTFVVPMICHNASFFEPSLFSLVFTIRHLLFSSLFGNSNGG